MRRAVTLPSDLIQRARSVPIERVLEERGILLRGRIERIGPCPRCGGTDKFAVHTRKGVFNCRKCGAKGYTIDLVRFLDDCDFRTAIERLCGSPINARPRSSGTGEPYIIRDSTEAGPRPSQSDEDAKRDLASARTIVSGIVPLIGTPGATYLRDVRKIDVQAIEDVLSRTEAIGWHPAVYLNQPAHPLHGQRLACIVGIMTDPVTAEPTGAISRTYVDRDLRKIAKAKTLGLPAGIIRLTPDEDVTYGLCLAEGLETALSAMAKGLCPVWATGSTALMKTFPILAGIGSLTVVADRDANGAGERAAREVEARWRSAGRETRIFMPASPGDLNDLLQRAKG